VLILKINFKIIKKYYFNILLKNSKEPPIAPERESSTGSSINVF